jgi:DNA-binding response OmpR family regulator
MGDPNSRRVLVVDDAPDMRAVICRVLGSRGYRVDAVGTLAEARSMTPAEYDAVLVDMRLGAEQGTTLITELIALDPRLASRCLLMSGGIAHVPAGVSALAKPFLPDELLGAVRALCGSEPAAAASARPEDGSTAPEPPSLPALLRERERAAVADALHDGPVQGLAAAVLGLHLIREQLPATQTQLLDSVARQIGEAATSLRGLMARLSPPWPGEPAGEIIRNQTAWLLAAPPVVEIHPPGSGMSHKTARLAADIAELALFLASGAPSAGGEPPNARIRALETGQGLDIETAISWAAGDPRDDALAGADTAWRERLRGELKSALRADVDLAWCPGELRVRVPLRGTFGS